MNFDIDICTIFKCIHGSHAYGTNIETSDVDYKGICIPPRSVLLGCMHTFEQYERMESKHGKEDIVIYALSKFARLAADNNPNIIEILFVDDNCIVKINKFGRKIRLNRDAFLSKRVKHTFSGFAHSQIHRIKSHRNWLLNPPTKEPIRKDFGLPDTMKISTSDLGAFDSLVSNNVQIELPHDIVKLFCAEKAYRTAKQHWDQYQNWKTTRNPTRAALEAKFGYDTKHASHVIRLLRMCREMLRDGVVNVRRSDAKELLEIRAGQWTYERLLEEADTIEQECNLLYETTKLPYSPDINYINDLVAEITLDCLFR